MNGVQLSNKSDDTVAGGIPTDKAYASSNAAKSTSNKSHDSRSPRVPIIDSISSISRSVKCEYTEFV
jgi:hypothetical protein